MDNSIRRYFDVVYNTTNTYGRLIRTIPNINSDDNFIKSFRVYFYNVVDTCAAVNSVTSSKFDGVFTGSIEETLIQCVSPNGSVDVFSESPDHLNRPMSRYLIFDKDKKYNYILDSFVNFDVKLDISPVKRFILKSIPLKFAKVNNSNIVPKLIYRVRLWNTPVTNYLITLFEVPLDCIPNTYSVDQARDMVGYPKIYDLKDRSMYERIDYDIRRALFNEISPIVQTGNARENIRIFGRNNNPC